MRPTLISEIYPLQFTVYVYEVNDLFYYKGAIGCNFHIFHPKLYPDEITTSLDKVGDKVRFVITIVNFFM